MSKEPPFDVWDGEELGLAGEVDLAAAEEVAMHVDPDSESPDGALHWSDLTDEDDTVDGDLTVRYFADEQPELVDPGDGSTARTVLADHEPDLEELLERQHYAFPER